MHRYTPLMRPVYITFPVAGIQVLEGKYFCNESTCRVELSLLGAKSTGNFKCEVSGDAPHFKLAAKEDNMTVAGKWGRDGRVGEALNSLLANLSLKHTHTQNGRSLAAKRPTNRELQLDVPLGGVPQCHLLLGLLQSAHKAHVVHQWRTGKRLHASQTALGHSNNSLSLPLLPLSLSFPIFAPVLQPMLGELQPTIDNSIPAHDYILRRQRLQVNFYLQAQRFYKAGKILELKCVAEIENYPELRRETTLSAALTPFDNMNNLNLMLRHQDYSKYSRSC